MKSPLDATDEASLVQADWHEEFGDLRTAEAIRDSLEPEPAWFFDIPAPFVGTTIGETVGTQVSSQDSVGCGSDGVGIIVVVGIGQSVGMETLEPRGGFGSGYPVITDGVGN